MRLIKILLLILIFAVGCKLFEDEINFTSKEDSYKTRYEILMPDSINIEEYAVFKNDELVEKNVFVYDSLKTEKWKLDKNNKTLAKRAYYFSIDNYRIVIDTIVGEEKNEYDTLFVNIHEFAKRKNAIITIDSVFYADSTMIIESEYSYNDSLLTEVRTSIYTHNGVYRTRGYYKNFYNKNKNIVKVNYEIEGGLCADEMKYTTIDNFINIQTFENELTGKFNNNLTLQAYWEKSCNEEKYQVKPSSLYSYELNGLGYVNRMIEEYTPEYMEFVGTTVERTIKTTDYEYFFE